MRRLFRKKKKYRLLQCFSPITGVYWVQEKYEKYLFKHNSWVFCNKWSQEEFEKECFRVAEILYADIDDIYEVIWYYNFTPGTCELYEYVDPNLTCKYYNEKHIINS